MAAAADVVSVHLALNDETRGLCNREFFGALKEGAYFVNTSRGGVVDGEALTWAVGERGIRAGLDVWNKQPDPTDTDPDGAGDACDIATG